MTPGHYTELFFLDEATALAAGHRPCAECRHARFVEFCSAWRAAKPVPRTRARPTASVIDGSLHAERLCHDGSKRSFTAALDQLPDGVIVTAPSLGDQSHLVLGARLLVWSPRGYAEQRRRPKGLDVTVLTPGSTVEAIRAGYLPEIHPSASPRFRPQ
jgi:hypothetical protein